MRQPLRIKNLRAQVAQPVTLPAPVGGWNAREALAAMAPTEAIELVNVFPDTSQCRVRGGSIKPRGVVRHSETLMVYARMTGEEELFAVGSDLGGQIVFLEPYTDTPSGVGLTTLVWMDGSPYPGLESPYLIWTMFGDGTNNYLIAVNGTDPPIYYWGEEYPGFPGSHAFYVVQGTGSPALTGPTLSSLSYVNVYKGRLFFLQKNSLSFWYLAAGAAGGALTEFTLAAEAKRGGYLVAMGNWTRDAGDGQDDVAVFITSEGEALVYQGNNPASATTWAKVGTFFIGKPLGPRCLLQYGADLLVLTETGIFPLSTALQKGTVENQYALSYKIEPAFTEAARQYGQHRGWRMTHYPREHALIVNVPIRPHFEYEQYVMNTITKAWCRFTDWNAEDFAVVNSRLYFSHTVGASGYVMEAWAGGHDFIQNAADELDALAYGHMWPIRYRARQAFTNLRSSQRKHITAIRPVLQLTGEREIRVGVDVDFRSTESSSVIRYVPSGACWDVARWDMATWPEEPTVFREMSTVVEEPGTDFSVRIEGAYVDQLPQSASLATELDVPPGIAWIATDLLAERGGVL